MPEQESTWGDIHDLRAKNRNGRYVARVYRHEDGKRSQVTATGRTRAEARAALEEKIGAVDDAAHGIRTLDQLAAAYSAAARERGRPKPRTILEHEETYARHIKPNVGQLHPAKLTRPRINRLIAGSPSPQHTDATLRVILDEGLMMGVVETNLARGAFKHATKKVRPRALTSDELAGLQAAFQAQADRLLRLDKDPSLTLDVFVALRETGLRLGEALALRAQDYVPKSGRLTAAGTITIKADDDGKKRSWRQPGGKTDAATRTITVPPAADDNGVYARNILVKRRAQAIDSGGEEGPLFPARSGAFLHTHAYRLRWRAALDRFAPEQKAVHPHLLRHTVATHVVRASVSKFGYAEGMERARLQLGHASLGPLRAYPDRTDLTIDNSDVLAELNPERTAEARLAEAVTATVEQFGVLALSVGRIDGLPAFYLLGENLLLAVEAIDQRFVGAVLIVDQNDPRIPF